MDLKKSVLIVGMALASGTVSAAPFSNFDTRAAGMGGLSVVTSSLDAAPFANPAMLAAGRKDEGFGLLFTGGVSVGDPDNLTQDLNDFQTSFDAFVISTLQDDLDAAEAAYNSAATKSMGVNVGGGAAMGFAWDKWAGAVSYQTTMTAESGVTYTDGGPSLTINPLDSTTNAAMQLSAVKTTDIGVSLARNFEVSDMELAVGVTPKISSVSAGSSLIALNVVDPGSASPDISFGSAESAFNLDAGAVLSITEEFKAGLVGKNMLANSVSSGSTTIRLEPQLRAGVGYYSRLYTVGLDLDITDNAPLASGSSTRYMIIGTEINAFDWAQLRAGYRTNTAKSGDENYAFGMGLSPFGANLNLALLYNPNSPDSSISGNLSFGLKF